MYRPLYPLRTESGYHQQRVIELHFDPHASLSQKQVT